MFKSVASELTQTRNALKKIHPYLRIVGREYIESPTSEEISVPLEKCEALVENKTCLLGENTSDCKWFIRMGKYYALREGFGSHLSFEEILGGGDTTGKLYSNILKDCRKLCLCIVDSDRKSYNSVLGNTAKKVQVKDKELRALQNCKYVTCQILEVHEIENLLPTELIRIDVQSKKEIELIALEGSQKTKDSTDWMYIDIKANWGPKILEVASDNFWQIVNKNYRPPLGMENLWNETGKLICAWGYAPNPQRT